MRKYSLYSVTGIDDWILKTRMILLECLDRVQTYEELINTSHEWIISKMKSWMNWFVSKSFQVQFLMSKVCIIFLSIVFELPKEGGLICIHHSMSYFFEDFVGFYSWILEKVSIYGCNLMCLAKLYGCIGIVFLYGCIYPISSIDHSKERWRIARVRKIE